MRKNITLLLVVLFCCALPVQIQATATTVQGDTDLNGALDVNKGGTNATTAAGARTNLGLGNVNNTADSSKPISSAQQAALNGKVDKTQTINGRALSGNVTLVPNDVLPSGAAIPDGVLATSQAATDVSLKVATTQFVDSWWAALWNRVGAAICYLAGPLNGTYYVASEAGLIAADASDANEIRVIAPFSLTDDIVIVHQWSIAPSSPITLDGNALTAPVPTAGLYQIFEGEGAVFPAGSTVYGQWWGAVPSLTVTSTVAWQYSSGSLPNGGHIRVTGGKFAGSWPIITVAYDGIEVVGDGKYAGSGFFALDGGLHKGAVNIDGHSHCAVRDLEIDGNKTNLGGTPGTIGYSGVSIISDSDNTLHNEVTGCWIHDIPGQPRGVSFGMGVEVYGGADGTYTNKYVKVMNNNLTDNDMWGVAIIQGQQCEISHNYIARNALGGIDAENNVSTQIVDSNKYVDNTVDCLDYGHTSAITDYGSRAEIKNNKIWGGSVKAYGYGPQITGNYQWLNHLAFGIRTGWGGGHGVISNNIMEDAGPNTGGYVMGIHLISGHWVVVGNQISRVAVNNSAYPYIGVECQPKDWAAAHTYTANQVVKPNPATGYIYECRTGGDSIDPGPPDWDSHQTEGEKWTESGGTVQWKTHLDTGGYNVISNNILTLLNAGTQTAIRLAKQSTALFDTSTTAYGGNIIDNIIYEGGFSTTLSGNVASDVLVPPSIASSANHAVCWKADGGLGYCSAVVDLSGVCGTCN